MPNKGELALTLDHALWFGRMYQELSVSTGGAISQQSLKKQSGSQNRKPPIFMYLQKDGLLQDAIWVTDGQLLGESLTLSIGECPNVGVESHLSQILEDKPHLKYSLSPKACQGILNRAKRRGKDLPEMLRTALEMQSHTESAAIMAQGHGHQPIAVYENHASDCRYNAVGDIAPTCTSRYGTGGGNVPIVVGFDRQRQGVYGESGVASTLTAHEGKEGNDIVCAVVDCRNGTENETTNGTLQSKPNGGISYNLNNVIRSEYIVRRLTPTECERLQGFPDGWTDIGEWTDSKGKKRAASDSARYKALGNSIAIPPWLWVCSQMGKHLGEDKTMASLFDGIGGFPLIWSFLYGTENCVWASEIEEFPIAVTKYRFGNKVKDLMKECLEVLGYEG